MLLFVAIIAIVKANETTEMKVMNCCKFRGKSLKSEICYKCFVATSTSFHLKTYHCVLCFPYHYITTKGKHWCRPKFCET